jgi:branched-chain amino acid transport system substrate-binding protein
MAVGVIAGCDSGGSTTASNSSGTSGSGNCTPTTFSNSDVGSDAIPIGLVASLTGESLPWGADCQKGAQLAVDEFNKAGGLNGKKVNLIISREADRRQPRDRNHR